jgi:ribosome-associated translation inhibitor RaiA
MRIQVNSDKTIAVDLRLVRYVQGEVGHRLQRFAPKLTRAEVHLSDVNSRKAGPADKRCLVEVRPANARPLAAKAQAATLSVAIGAALDKMERRLDGFFGRQGRTAARMEAGATAPKPRRTAKRKSARAAVRRAAREKALVKQPAKLSPRGPKKKRIYLARRKSWPAKRGLETR